MLEQGHTASPDSLPLVTAPPLSCLASWDRSHAVLPYPFSFLSGLWACCHGPKTSYCLPLLMVAQRSCLEPTVVAKSVVAQQKGFGEKAGRTPEELLVIITSTHSELWAPRAFVHGIRGQGKLVAEKPL